MKPSKNYNKQSKISQDRSKSTRLPNLPNWLFPSAALIVLLFFSTSIFNNSNKTIVSNTNDSRLNLKATELDPNLASQNQAKAQVEAPRYGLQDQTVNQEQVIINLRDNGFQDGDLVTLSVNDRVIVADHYLLNKGSAIPVSIRPGVNLVKVYGVRDGANNGLGISLAADVLNQGNATSSLFPENATATFNIIRP